jgi:hypothetical protein
MIIIIMIIIIIIIIPLNRVLPEKVTGSQLVKKFPAFNGTHRFVTAFTSAATCPYPEPDECSPCLPFPLLEDPCYSYPLICISVFQEVFFPQISPTKPCEHLSYLPYLPQVSPRSSFLF